MAWGAGAAAAAAAWIAGTKAGAWILDKSVKVANKILYTALTWGVLSGILAAIGFTATVVLLRQHVAVIRVVWKALDAFVDVNIVAGFVAFYIAVKVGKLTYRVVAKSLFAQGPGVVRGFAARR